MNSPRNKGSLSVFGLALLAMLALILGTAAMLQHRGGTGQASVAGTATPTPAPTRTASASPESTPSASRWASTPAGPTVVVIGDSYSVGDPTTTWVGQAARQLGWGELTNLSSPGRGFITRPRECDFFPCDTFSGTISVIAAIRPDVVVTFGGTADGDYSLEGYASDYFWALRAALPNARLIAISPVTTEASADYWLTLHRDTIRSATQEVGGTFVDVGQPGLGDGAALSSQSQAEIAELVVRQLS